MLLLTTFDLCMYFLLGPWSKSTKVEKPICESRRMENFVADRSGPYQYNYRAESLDPLKIIERAI